MRRMVLFAVAVCAATPVYSATFGTGSGPPGGASYTDIVLDEPRNQLYLVNSANNRIDIFNTRTRSFGAAVTVSSQPVAAALGWPVNGSSRYLYVTAYGGSSLYQIDLTKNPPAVSTRVSLPYNPEGVSAGSDGRILVTTTGPGNNNSVNTLFLFDPNASTGNNLISIPLPVPPPTSPVNPTTPGREFLAYRSALLATPDGKYIIGANGINGTTRLIFIYETASATVLRSREVTNLSNVLSVAPDGSRFMAGSTLFDINTLQVIAQENVSNSPFAFPAGNASNFNLQQNQGGSVFSPDGSQLYAAFNINPYQSPPAKANTTQLLINDPQNLSIQMGLQMPENLAGKMVITKAGDTVYGISDTGFITLPISTIGNNPLAATDSQVVYLANDQCGVTAKLSSGVNNVTNIGKGRLSVNVQSYTIPAQGTAGLGGFGGPGGGGIFGGPGGGGIIIILPILGPGGGTGLPTGPTTTTSGTGPIARVQPGANGATITFSYNLNAAKNGLGTGGESDFLIQSPEAINIPANIRVFQNNRDAAAAGQVIPVPTNINAGEGLQDMLADYNRQRLYITNSGLNRIEVFDMKSQQFLSPIKTGQLPHNMAFGTDGNTLYVANTGGESISIVDLSLGQVVGSVKFPPVPMNAATSIITPQAMAATFRGPLVIMSDGSLWKIDGDQATPRGLNQVVFGTGARTIAAGNGTGAFRTMASTPEGQYVIVFTGTGNAYLYDAASDDFTLGKQIFATTALTGYLGPIAAGPRGQYYIVNGVVLNSSLTPISNIPNSASGVTVGTGPGGLPGGGRTANIPTTRPISAVAALSSGTFAVFSNPIRLTNNTASTDGGIVQVMDVATANPLGIYSAIEGPASVISGNNRAVTPGRTMTVDATGSHAYVLSVSGLSIIPMTTVPLNRRPLVANNGVVNLASYQPSVAPGGLAGIFGTNLASQATASASTLPMVLGGVCVTVNNAPVPLIATTPGQINAQIPTNIAPGRYPLVVHSIANQVMSAFPATVTVGKYAPAVFADSNGRAAIYHSDGSPVTPDNPTTRDQKLTLYATGLGATTGGVVTTGMPAPSKPLAVTGPVSVYFGPSNYSQSAIAVQWSGLVPGMVGVYQLDLYVPGTHMKGDALPVSIKIGGVSSPTTGPVIPTVAIH